MCIRDSNLTVVGTLTGSDVDDASVTFQAQTISGSYGSLTIDAAGAWTYTANNSSANVQELYAGEAVTDTIVVASTDGTTQNITITLTGTNDLPTLTGQVTASKADDAGTFTVDLLNGASDVDGDTLTIANLTLTSDEALSLIHISEPTRPY